MFTPEIMDVHLTPIGFAGVFAANFPKHHFSRERVERCLGLEGHDSCNHEKIHRHILKHKLFHHLKVFNSISKKHHPEATTKLKIISLLSYHLHPSEVRENEVISITIHSHSVGALRKFHRSGHKHPSLVRGWPPRPNPLRLRPCGNFDGHVDEMMRLAADTTRTNFCYD